MLRRHTCGDTGQLSRGRAVSWRTQRMRVALSRATAGHLGPGGACHSETIQSCQPVPLASVALLLRRARFDYAVGRLGLRRIGPRLAARRELFRSKKIDKRGRTR